MAETIARIESELDVRAYLQDLKYALEHGAKVTKSRFRKSGWSISIEISGIPIALLLQTCFRMKTRLLL